MNPFDAVLAIAGVTVFFFAALALFGMVAWGGRGRRAPGSTDWIAPPQGFAGSTAEPKR